MKKYNHFDRHTFLLGILIPFLTFFISVNTTYAYFTASTTAKESTTVTAIIKISLNNVDDTVTDIKQVVTSSTEETVTNKVLPGDTLSVGGKLVNTGTAECYALLEFTLNIKKANSDQTETPAHKYYTFVTAQGNPPYTLQEITGTENNYSATACKIAKDGERDFAITYNFVGANYDESYINATISYTVKAYAIQTGNLASTEAESARVATNILMQYATT